MQKKIATKGFSVPFVLFFLLFLGLFIYTFPSISNSLKKFSKDTVGANTSLVAFPDAEGFGASSIGGRGGMVYIVSNTQDYNPNNGEAVIPGSLRECVDAKRNPESDTRRICVFSVAGYITLTSQLKVSKPYLTIAGQTAPGDGITLRIAATNAWGPMKIQTHNVILRYLRLRPGLNPNQAKQPGGENDYNIDALTIGEINYNPTQIVVDHVSMSWGTDEILNTWYSNDNITVQWSIMSEPIFCNSDASLCGGKGPLIGGREAQNTSFHHNLMAHNRGRNPMIKTGGTGVTDVVNNVMFVPSQTAASVSDEMNKIFANFVGNTVIAPNGDGLVYGVAVLGNKTGGYDLYMQGNIGPHRTSDSQPEYLFVNPNGQSYVRTTRNTAPDIQTTSASQAYEQVLQTAGASRRLNELGEWVSARDSIDNQILNDVQSQTTRIITSSTYPPAWPLLSEGTPYPDNDLDGMSDTWEVLYFSSTTRGSPTDSSSDYDGDGYTDLEEFLNGTNPTTGNTSFTPTPTIISTSTPTVTLSPTTTSTPSPTQTLTNTPTPTPTPTPISSIDTTSPSVTITFPSNNGTVKRDSRVTITASASDNVGVTKVEFYVKGERKCTDTTASYTCVWKVPLRAGVSYRIEARAYDARGNVGTHTINVTSVN